jgi:hypothetical protein
MSELNDAEQRFADYLDAHGYTWSHEPDYQTELGLPTRLETRPDFLIARAGSRAVGEVRQFETTHIRDGLAKAGGYMSTGPREVYGSLRFGMWEKAKQLRPLAGAGVPLLIVLANPLGADVMLDAHHVQAAMWGNPGFVIPIDTSTGGPAEGQEMYWRLEDYGVFASPVMQDGKLVGWENRHPHVSAVLVVHERLYSMDWREEVMHRHPAADNSFEAATEAALKAIKEINAASARGEEPQGAYQWVTVYEVNGDEAERVPANWFDGERDERYGYTDGGYGQLSLAPVEPGE